MAKKFSLGIIKKQLRYQYEIQKIFLRGKKFWLVFPFNFRRLPARKKCMLSIFLRLRKITCFFSDSLFSVFPLEHPNPPWYLKLSRSPLYLQKGLLPLSLSHSPRNLLLPLITIVYAKTQSEIVGCKINLAIIWRWMLRPCLKEMSMLQTSHFRTIKEIKTNNLLLYSETTVCADSSA